MANSNLSKYIQLIRPEQWIKNLFVLAPVLFAGKILQHEALFPSLIAMISFCLVSSAVYCINDAADAEADRHHSKKRTRPVASGAISRINAFLTAILLFACSILLSWAFIDHSTMFVLASYLVINIGYTFWLKYIAIIDICIIAIGFLLRLCAGALASEGHLSAWIVVVTFILSLFLALGKRREDSDLIQPDSKRRLYSSKFIDMAMVLTGSAVIVSYFIYTITPSQSRIITSELFYLSGIPVLTGILRYIQICVDANSGANHHRLLFKDNVILLSIVTYALMLIIFLYGTNSSI